MAYCTRDDLEAVLSQEGVDLRVDDVVGDVADAIEEADTDIDGALAGFFTAASIAASTWVKHRAKILASYYLCCRRANLASASLSARYQKVVEELEKILEKPGKVLGAGLVWSKAGVPTMSSVRPTLRPFPRTVIERTRSTGKPEGYRQNNRDPLDRTNQYLDYSI